MKLKNDPLIQGRQQTSKSPYNEISDDIWGNMNEYVKTYSIAVSDGFEVGKFTLDSVTSLLSSAKTLGLNVDETVKKIGDNLKKNNVQNHETGSLIEFLRNNNYLQTLGLERVKPESENHELKNKILKTFEIENISNLIQAGLLDEKERREIKKKLEIFIDVNFEGNISNSDLRLHAKTFADIDKMGFLEGKTVDRYAKQFLDEIGGIKDVGALIIYASNLKILGLLTEKGGMTKPELPPLRDYR